VEVGSCTVGAASDSRWPLPVSSCPARDSGVQRRAGRSIRKVSPGWIGLPNRSRGKCKGRQSVLSEFAGAGSGLGSPLETLTLPDPGSTSQTTTSPNSSPSIAATGSGTVVRIDSERLRDRTARDSNRLAIDSPITLRSGRLKNYGLDVGLPVANAKYDPFVGLQGGHQMAVEARQEDPRRRGLAIAARSGSVTPGVDATSFVVLDPLDMRKRLVSSSDGRWHCSGALNEPLTVGRCAHVWAVHFTIASRGSPEAVSTRLPRRSYPQGDWRAYREGQKGENRFFDPALISLLGNVPEPSRPPGRAGRPSTPLREALFITVKKAHEGLSLTRLHGKLPDLADQGKLSAVPNYSLPARILGRADLTPILLQLVRESAKPMIGFERGGTIAIDSSGFTTSVFGAYLTETHEPNRRHEFVRGHIAIGTRTHVVTNLSVTSQHSGDSPQFETLLRGTLNSGFQPAVVVADKAYLSRANYKLAAELGVKAVIPFRSNVGPNPKGVREWRDMWHLAHEQPEEFGKLYHSRSNVEAAFSAVKRKLGESLFSRRPVARQNELICKFLAYNLTVIIQQIFERELNPSTLYRSDGNDVASVPEGPDNAEWMETDPESIEAAVNESGVWES
jgi:transposase